jgi:nucleosome binding factor SPN SPT16 subunit
MGGATYLNWLDGGFSGTYSDDDDEEEEREESSSEREASESAESEYSTSIGSGDCGEG